MKIIVPLRDYRDVETLVESGADEFFCGVQHRTGANRFFYNLNRRSSANANFQGFDDLKKAVAVSHRLSRPVSLAVNERFTKKQYPYIDEMITNADKSGVDNIIVSDFGLLLYLNSKRYTDRFNITMGTGAVNFNAQTVAFYRQYNAHRITFSRKIYPEEIIHLQKKCKEMNVQTKAFIQANGYCPNLDGLCNFQHVKDERSNYGACGNLQTEYRTASDSEFNYHVEHSYFSNCNICFLYDLVRIGTDYIKLLDRTSTIKGLKVSIPLLKTLIDKAGRIPSKHQYVLYVVNNYLDIMPHINCKKETCYFKDDFQREFE